MIIHHGWDWEDMRVGRLVYNPKKIARKGVELEKKS
jgi:hypothetical protein